VRQCVQAFNPSLADSGADEFMAEDFRGRDCVRLCNENLYQALTARVSRPLIHRILRVTGCLLIPARPARQPLKALTRTEMACATISSAILN
jgi:hypothetical protein